MSGYIGPIPVPQGIQNKESFTATAAQTTFNTNGYTDGAFISVYLNGVRLVNGTDYTATNGSDVVLASAANTGDVLDFETFNSFSLVSQTFDNLTTKNPTHEDTDGGRESALSFQGEQSGGEISTLAAIQASHDGTADDQKGDLIFKTNDGSDNNAPTERLRIDSDGSIVPATLGTSNVKLGLNAGKVIASGGNYNTVIGEEAGAALSTGDVNTFVGYQSGDATTTSGNNVGVGYASLTTNILSSKNVAIGNNALKTHNLGSAGDGLNVAVGHGAGEALTTGARSTLVGYASGAALIDPDRNVAFGYGSLQSDTKGTKSTAIGYSALNTQNFSSATDSHNTAVGYTAAESLTTGSNNTFVGSLAGDAITTSNSNTAVGKSALSAETSSNGNTAVGELALGVQNVGGSGDARNTAVGLLAGGAVTTGTNNTYIGALVGDANDIGEANVAIGGGSNYAALGADTKGKHSTAVGFGALTAQNFTSDTQTLNTAVGYFAGGVNATGTGNTFIGAFAGDDTNDGQDNVAIGVNALSANCDNTNVAVGNVALFVCTGAANTALGTSAGRQITSGINNTCLGKDSGRSGSPGGPVESDSNVVCIGDENVASCHIQVDWTVASDKRDKTDVTPMEMGLDFVNKLEPVTYKWDKRSKYGDKYADDYDLDAQTPDGTHKEDWLDVGFKAQEVEVLEKAAGYKIEDKTNLTTTLAGDGKQYGIKYEKFVPILVKAIQELSAKVKALEDA